jgi:Uncharacterized conserved protein
MTIGIDIDDVITNTAEILVAYAQLFNFEYLKKHNHLEKEKVYSIINGDTLANNCGWNEEEVIEFKKKYHEHILINSNIKPLAKEIIDRLISEGHEIHLITARNSAGDLISDSYKVSEKLLSRNKINYHKLVTECSDKLSYCKNNNVNIFIDDSLPTCQSVATSNTKVFLMNGPHNINFDEKNITRVYSWSDFYYQINKILE